MGRGAVRAPSNRCGAYITPVVGIQVGVVELVRDARDDATYAMKSVTAENLQDETLRQQVRYPHTDQYIYHSGCIPACACG